MSNIKNINISYEIAREAYAEIGVDTEKAIELLKTIPLSIHCWQGDDVGGFETQGVGTADGGMQVTGNYPGKANTVDELRSDMEKALSLIPGTHRVNIHAIYGEFNGKQIDRDEIEPIHFQGWIDWAKSNNLKLDFNSTLFSNPKAASGLTLSDNDRSIRDFWIEHVKRCRKIGSYIGKSQNDACIHNLWIPDGVKDITVNRFKLRAQLKDSLDKIYSVVYASSEIKDSVESKLFGIGSEYSVVGSHDFYMPYAILNNLMICLDMGHFHPTESVADKLSALLLYFNEIVMHVSRGIRWDSDHVVIINDELRNVMEEIVRCDATNRVHLALDYFDASINRIGAWVIGARSTLRALLMALLEPISQLKSYEENNRFFERLALLEELKSMPFNAVWDQYCLTMDVPIRTNWISEIIKYENSVTFKR